MTQLSEVEFLSAKMIQTFKKSGIVTVFETSVISSIGTIV